MKNILSILLVSIILMGCSEKDVRKDGLNRGWYGNGQLKWEGNFKDGKEDDLYKRWYANGQLYWEGNYKDGERDGLQRGWYGYCKTNVKKN